MEKIDGQPIWQSMIFDGKSDTKINAIWKSSNNGNWMIGEKEDLQNPKIRGSGREATPDKCLEWSYLKTNDTKDWTPWATSTASGLNVKCMKGKKFLREAIVYHFKIISLQKPYISS